MDAGPALPLWFTAPLGAIVMVFLAGHMIALREAADRLPSSRVRIRAVNNAVMLLLVPMLVFAFSVSAPDRPRVFTLTWMASIGLLGLTLLLAMLDVANNARLAASEKRALRAEMRRAAAAIVEARAAREPALGLVRDRDRSVEH